jgi:hypothetical protein
MRQRMGIGVVVAVVLFGLAAPGFSSADRSDHVVTAGLGPGIGEAIERGLQRGLQILSRLFGRTRLNPAEVEAATLRIKGIIPTVHHTLWGEVELSPRQWWQLVDVACTAKDIDDFQREQEIDDRLGMLEAQVPGAVGFRASVRALADEMDEADSTGDRVEVAATAVVCAAADQALG